MALPGLSADGFLPQHGSPQAIMDQQQCLQGDAEAQVVAHRNGKNWDLVVV